MANILIATPSIVMIVDPLYSEQIKEIMAQKNEEAIRAILEVAGTIMFDIQPHEPDVEDSDSWVVVEDISEFKN